MEYIYPDGARYESGILMAADRALVLGITKAIDGDRILIPVDCSRPYRPAPVIWITIEE